MDDVKSLVDRIRNAKKKYQDGVSKLYTYHCFLHPGSGELGFREHDTNSGPDDFLNKQKILFDELNEELELICNEIGWDFLKLKIENDESIQDRLDKFEKMCKDLED